MINRYSSRHIRLDKHYLADKLRNAKSYDRIAGYFSSSVLEVAGEAIDSISGKVRLVCNSQIEQEDYLTATSAAAAMRREWCSVKPEELYLPAAKRLKHLYSLLKSGKLAVRVLPNNVFGLMHGKAGVITLADGNRTSFIGSVNETLSAWRLNYEMLWEDDSPEAVKWVQDEFNYFWEHHAAIPLAEFVVEDIGRIADRVLIGSIKEWKEQQVDAEDPRPAQVAVEAPVFREELGLWEHQKSFVDIAFRDHKKNFGARFVLADQVGLGKTIQLALSAQLMALWGDGPVLVIVPKTLSWQWQEEMNTLLDMPSAVFTGKEWVDENGVKYPHNGDIRRCPRRVGIISQGIIVHGRSDYLEQLLSKQYECVIIDEAHRARRRNLGEDKAHLKPEPNNLYRFLLKMAKNTHSMLLATATPVQMYPVEAWDLLNILSQKNSSVLGSDLSNWRRDPQKALDLIMGKTKLGTTPVEMIEQCEWLRNPFPPAEEDPMTFGSIRRRHDLPEDQFVVGPENMKELIMSTSPESRKVKRIIERGFIENHNPFIRHIIRRTREFLENNINPETGEPYLKRIEVELLGEKDDEAITLPPYLEDAYGCAEEFCSLLGTRVRGSGFIETLLLKRVGSTMIAGRKTAEKMLRWGSIDEEMFEEDEDSADFSAIAGPARNKAASSIKEITEAEIEALTRFIKTLDENRGKDPKYELTLDLLTSYGFQQQGCIVFSQYFDSVFWVAENLSKDLKGVHIGLYAGGDKSGIIINGKYIRHSKEDIKKKVKQRELKILVGTDAASEGLNLQTLSTLINLDLPWNPTRLEQRKGRIQRIGQLSDKVTIYNMRYKGSVEDRVHALLSKRLRNINAIFGQLPDVLEDVWVQVAMGNRAEAEKIIDAVPEQHPFEIKYEKQVTANTNWEECSQVLNAIERRECLLKGWV